MSKKLIYIILPILLTVVGEFLLKASVDDVPLTFTLDSLWFVATSPGIIFGVAFIAISALLWIVGMSQFQLSFMYPFLSLNYVIIIVGSEFLLNEDVQWNRYASIVLIMVGLLIISRSPNAKVRGVKMTTKSNELSNVISGIEPSLTMSITALAGKLRAEGASVIGFGAGEPDFDTPDQIKKAAIAAIESGKKQIYASGRIARIEVGDC